MKHNLQGKLSLIRAPLHGKKRTVVHNVEFASTVPLLQGQVLICLGGVDCGVDCADWANLFERHPIKDTVVVGICRMEEEPSLGRKSTKLDRFVRHIDASAVPRVSALKICFVPSTSIEGELLFGVDNQRPVQHAHFVNGWGKTCAHMMRRENAKEDASAVRKGVCGGGELSNKRWPSVERARAMTKETCATKVVAGI